MRQPTHCALHKNPLISAATHYIVHCNKELLEVKMADETKIEAQAAAEAPAKVVEAIAETAEKAAEAPAKAVKAARKPARMAGSTRGGN